MLAKNNNVTIFTYAEVGRYGLAHSLLAWARCEIWSKDKGYQMLAPSWFFIKIGPVIRNERDKRNYYKLFDLSRYIGGAYKYFLLFTLPKIDANKRNIDKLIIKKSSLIIFTNTLQGNEENFFHEIVGRNDEVRNSLMSIVKKQLLPKAVSYKYIAIHIRMGDFQPKKKRLDLKKGEKNSRLPLEWYIEILEGLRKKLGHVIPAIIYSDGNFSELKPILECEKTSLSQYSSAITDLLSISNASVLISSGSGFSMWGSFLGNVPRICYPSQRFVRVLKANNLFDMEPECETAEDIKNDFIIHLKNNGL